MFASVIACARWGGAWLCLLLGLHSGMVSQSRGNEKDRGQGARENTRLGQLTARGQSTQVHERGLAIRLVQDRVLRGGR